MHLDIRIRHIGGAGCCRKAEQARMVRLYEKDMPCWLDTQSLISRQEKTPPKFT